MSQQTRCANGQNFKCVSAWMIGVGKIASRFGGLEVETFYLVRYVDGQRVYLLTDMGNVKRFFSLADAEQYLIEVAQ